MSTGTTSPTLLDQLVFALAERDLVADLVEVAHACEPSPYRPRTARLIFCRLRKTLSICRVMTSAGRCSITLTRMPVPTFVGQAVR